MSEERGKWRVRRTANQVETTCHECGATLYMYPSQFKQAPRHFCDKLCLGAWRSKQPDSHAAHWQGGEKIERGRVYWHLPWHPRADSKGYVARSIVVAEITLRRPIAPGEVVHHKDEDTSNDHPTNLEVQVNQAEHARLHGLRRSAEQMATMRAAKKGAA